MNVSSGVLSSFQTSSNSGLKLTCKQVVNLKVKAVLKHGFFTFGRIIT